MRAPEPHPRDTGDDASAMKSTGRHPGLCQAGPAALERLREIDRLFDAALDRPPDERTAFLDAAATLDPDVVAGVRRLLEAHAASGAFLETPAPELVQPVLRDLDLIGNPPKRIGPFRTVRAIGMGGMGAVFLAERDDRQFEQRVALKLVRHMGAADLVPRFLEERRILARLEHPSIARLLDGGITGEGIPWFAMEYVDGEPIDRYCDARALTIDQRLRLFASVCDAVQHAHQHFIVHRDLKPSNILVAADGQLKLLDFGVAKLLDAAAPSEEPGSTRSQLQPMTPEYAAPEQVRGEPASAATDVYALGVLLYVLLTGQRPYQLRGHSPAQVERIVCELLPPRPSATCGGSPAAEAGCMARAHARATTPERLKRALAGDLDTIVLKALSKEPRERYASAEALVQDVRRHLSGHPVQARRQTPGYRARRLVKRHWIETVAALGMTLSLVAGAVLSLAEARRARAERDQAAAASRETAAVNTFLLQLFQASDPADAGGDTLTAGELVRRAATRVAQLRGDPTEKARLLEVTGRLYESLGRYQQEAAAVQRALALRRSGGVSDGLELADALLELSQALTHLARFPAADSALRQALSIQERRLGRGDPALAATLHLLASSAVYLGDIAGSVADDRRALAIREHALGEGDSLTARSHVILGTDLERQGHLREAEQQVRQGLSILERLPGADPLEVSWAAGVLAELLDQGELRPAAAEPLYRRELAIRRRVFGEEYAMTAFAESDLAEFLSRHGQGAEAIPLARRFLSTVRRSFGAENPITATATAEAAAVLFQSGDLDGADPLFRDAIAMDRRLRGRDHESVAGVETSFARLLIARRDFPAAETMLRDALRIADIVYGPEHPRTALMRGVAGLLLLREGRYAEADAVLRHSISVLEPRIDRNNAGVRELYGWLAEVDQGRAHPGEAAAPAWVMRSSAR